MFVEETLGVNIDEWAIQCEIHTTSIFSVEDFGIPAKYKVLSNSTSRPFSENLCSRYKQKALRNGMEETMESKLELKLHGLIFQNLVFYFIRRITTPKM